MTWNHNMAEAPRGTYRTVPSGKRGTTQVFEPASVIVASACGVVTVAHWLDDQRRWNLFTADVAPIAWQPCDPARTKTIIARNGKAISVPDLPPHPTKATSWFADMLAERRAA